MNSKMQTVFYDPDMYHWLAFQNLCSATLDIVYIPYDPGYGGSLMTLAPGRHTGTGLSRDEVSQKRGHELYVCPAGYIPVDANDRYVTRVNTSFRCKEK